jgi:hypothetical protein
MTRPMYMDVACTFSDVRAVFLDMVLTCKRMWHAHSDVLAMFIDMVLTSGSAAKTTTFCLGTIVSAAAFKSERSAFNANLRPAQRRREFFGVFVSEETTMRVMTSLFAMLLVVLMGCSKTDDSADRAAPAEQTPPTTTPDETATAPPSDTSAMPPSDQPPPPPPGEETTPPATPPNQ